ncbi:MAG TPA: SDR family NAD(P)-dependent oxidoreductase [Sphingobium sp.]|nr:SDR family NAD(P)-dependent oxidoreductase [Sphingobium sp.]
MIRFDGKVGVITGGASGIGAAVAQLFAANGGTAVIADLDASRGHSIVQEIQASGGKAHFVPCDLGDAAMIDGMFDTAVARHGRIDFLHNNGYAPWRGEDAGALAADISDGQWQHVINLGITSAFRAVRRAIPIMAAQGGGSIVNTSSTAAFHAEPRIGAYAVAKAALSQLTRAVAVEYASMSIRCNAVCPGVIQTPLIAGAPLDADFMRTIPMGRLGTPEEIAHVVLFLASDLASYVTGAIVVADGGRTI